ncbi:MAG: glkA1 [Phycisphaerales bacterium]|nr:glkA1 [Phycisphaerales bacterium]
MAHAKKTSLGIDIGGTAVKLAALCGGEVLWTARHAYRTAGPADLVGAVRAALVGRDEQFAAAGLCVPGLLDERRERVVYAVNVPELNGVSLEELVASAVGRRLPVTVTNDSVAGGYDVYSTQKLGGRLLVLALGTGVGAAVLDDGVPLDVENGSPGHIGHCDVSLESEPAIGPDGGAGSLEAYIGASALRARYGPDAMSIASRIGPNDPPVRALARAVRICHAIYRPHHVVLAGGLGIRLGHVLAALRGHVDRNLTALARPGWTLGIGTSDFHAASGAARLAISGMGD